MNDSKSTLEYHVAEINDATVWTVCLSLIFTLSRVYSISWVIINFLPLSGTDVVLPDLSLALGRDHYYPVPLPH